MSVIISHMYLLKIFQLFNVLFRIKATGLRMAPNVSKWSDSPFFSLISLSTILPLGRHVPPQTCSFFCLELSTCLPASLLFNLLKYFLNSGHFLDQLIHKNVDFPFCPPPWSFYLLPCFNVFHRTHNTGLWSIYWLLCELSHTKFRLSDLDTSFIYRQITHVTVMSRI